MRSLQARLLAAAAAGTCSALLSGCPASQPPASSAPASGSAVSPAASAAVSPASPTSSASASPASRASASPTSNAASPTGNHTNDPPASAPAVASSAAAPAAPRSSLCFGGSLDCACFAPRSVMRTSEGGSFQHTYDTNGCAPAKEVTNSCCNPAVKGPTFRDGQCCYRFQTGSCCGRPLLVAGALLVAPLRRSPW